MIGALVRVKYICRLGYGDSLPKEEGLDGSVPVFGSNGQYAVTSTRNTDIPAIVIGRKGSYGKVNWASNGCFASDTTFFVDEHLTTSNLRWLYWSLQTLGLDEGSQEAAVPGLNRESVYEERIYLPSTADQKTVANHLDRETSRIDRLITEKERMLALLEEKRAALISRVITRGLDPSAPLKPSGQEWLGEIPAHWRVLRLKFATSGIDQGSSPQCYSYPAEPGNLGVLKTGCVNGGEFRERENKALPDETEAFLDSEVQQGDVLMSRASGSVDLIGSVAQVARQPAARLLLSDKIYRFRVRDDVLDRRFMVLAMSACYLRHQIRSVISGAEGLANNIAKSDILEFLLVVPPVHEQERIVSYLGGAIKRNKVLCESLSESIALAKERRAALITAAVTGQISIEEMA